MSASLSTTPAWPFIVHTAGPLQPFDSLWCSEDNRVRVATVGKRFFVSLDGDNYCGPHKTFEAAQAYGDRGRK